MYTPANILQSSTIYFRNNYFSHFSCSTKIKYNAGVGRERNWKFIFIFLLFRFLCTCTCSVLIEKMIFFFSSFKMSFFVALPFRQDLETEMTFCHLTPFYVSVQICYRLDEKLSAIWSEAFCKRRTLQVLDVCQNEGPKLISYKGEFV